METRKRKQDALEAAKKKLRPRHTAGDNKPGVNKAKPKPKPSRAQGPRSKTTQRTKVGPLSKMPASPQQINDDKADAEQSQPRRSNRLLRGAKLDFDDEDPDTSPVAPQDMDVDEPDAVLQEASTPMQRRPGGSAYAGRFSKASQVPLRFDYVAVPPLPPAHKQLPAGPQSNSPVRAKNAPPTTKNDALNTAYTSPRLTETSTLPKRKRRSSPTPSSRSTTPLPRPPAPPARLAKKQKLSEAEESAGDPSATPNATLPRPSPAASNASGKAKPAAKGKGRAVPATNGRESPAKAAHRARNAYAHDLSDFVERRSPHLPDPAAEEYLEAWSNSFDFISGPPGQHRKYAAGAYTQEISRPAPTPSPVRGSPSRTPDPSPCPPRGRPGPLLDLRNVAKPKPKRTANARRSLASESGPAFRSQRTSKEEHPAPVASTSKHTDNATPLTGKPPARSPAPTAALSICADDTTPRASKPPMQSFTPTLTASTSNRAGHATPLNRSTAPPVFKLFTPSSADEESEKEDADEAETTEEDDTEGSAGDDAGPSAAGPSKSDKGKQKARGAIPDDIRQEGEQLGMNYMREVYALAHRAGKDPIKFMKTVGWMHPDHCQPRERSVRNRFCSAYAFERKGPAGSRSEVKAEAEGVYDRRVKALADELGHDPSQLDLAAHFARELQLAEWIREQNAKAGTAGVRRRRLKNTASKFTKIATAQELSDGVTVFGWAVDTQAREGQTAGAMLFGAGEAFEAIMKDYGGELRPLADKMTAKLRDCQMSTREGWAPGDPLPGLPAPKNNSGPNAFSTDKYARARGGRENRSDWAWRVLRTGLRADIGRMSRLVGQSSSRKSKPGDIPGQMNFRQNASLCYEWEMELVNWSPVLMDSLPIVIPKQTKPTPDGRPLDENDAITVEPASLADIKQSPDDTHPLGKPASDGWAEVADSMRQKRMEVEEEIIKKDLGVWDAFELMRAKGAPAFLPVLQEDLEGKELAEMGDTPMVTDGSGNVILTWRDGSRRWLEDALNGVDTRAKWQPWRSDDEESAGRSTAKPVKAGKQRSAGQSQPRAPKKRVKSRAVIEDEDIDGDKELVQFLMAQKYSNMRTREDTERQWHRAATAGASGDAGMDIDGEIGDEDDDVEDSRMGADAQDADYEDEGEYEDIDDHTDTYKDD